MFAIPGLILLVVFDFFKPQEYVPALASLPLLYLFTGAAVLGFLVDLRLGHSRLAPAPQLWLALLFVAWCAVTDLPLGAGLAARNGFNLLIPFSLFLLLAHTVQSFRALQVMVGTVLLIGLGLAFIGTHQGFAPWGCHRKVYSQAEVEEVHDGRACTPDDPGLCARSGGEPGVEYVCERVGLLGSQSVEGRVRFRGTLQDPNELSMAVSAILPLALAFFSRRRTAPRLLLLVATVGLAGTCAVLTRSRGGQLVFLAVLGIYFVQGLGRRGALLAVLGALPILALGGRTTADAASSTVERLECWSRGMQLFRASPILGVGLGQFTEHHYLTAHNSLVLTAAELGLPGMFLWCAVVYVSIRTPLQVLRGAPDGGGGAAPVARTWAQALLAALGGLVCGAFLLSYAYKEVLWIYVGLSGALHQAVRRHHPGFEVPFRLRDAGRVLVISLGLATAVTLYTRFELGHW